MVGSDDCAFSGGWFLGSKFWSRRFCKSFQSLNVGVACKALKNPLGLCSIGLRFFRLEIWCEMPVTFIGKHIGQLGKNKIYRCFVWSSVSFRQTTFHRWFWSDVIGFDDRIPYVATRLRGTEMGVGSPWGGCGCVWFLTLVGAVLCTCPPNITNEWQARKMPTMNKDSYLRIQNLGDFPLPAMWSFSGGGYRQVALKLYTTVLGLYRDEQSWAVVNYHFPFTP